MNNDTPLLRLICKEEGQIVEITTNLFSEKIVIDKQNNKIKFIKSFFEKLIFLSFKNDINYNIYFEEDDKNKLNSINKSILELLDNNIQKYIDVFSCNSVENTN